MKSFYNIRFILFVGLLSIARAANCSEAAEFDPEVADLTASINNLDVKALARQLASSHDFSKLAEAFALAQKAQQRPSAPLPKIENRLPQNQNNNLKTPIKSTAKAESKLPSTPTKPAAPKPQFSGRTLSSQRRLFGNKQ